MTELRRRLIEELQLRNYSPNTVEIYVRCVAKFAQHFKLAPDRLGPEHIREYQLYLVQREKVAWAVFNQTVCALCHADEHRTGSSSGSTPPNAIDSHMNKSRWHANSALTRKSW
jgi:Phage integrase, N-terminal SAM-like domain